MQKPALTAENIDAAKKTLGSVLLVAALVVEIAWPDHGRVIGVLTALGTLLLGLGLQSARGKALEALVSQTFGTSKPSEGAVGAADRAASLAPPQRVEASPGAGETWTKQVPPPPPRSKP